MNYEALHRELWNWLAQNPGKEKGDWPRWEWNGSDIPFVSEDCFACGLVTMDCIICPICDYDPDKDECLNGLFGKWHKETGKERAALAKQIANLPWKEKA